MKLDQIITPDEKQYYIWKCEVCGYTITTEDKNLRPVCPNCHQWAEGVAEEMREGDGKESECNGVEM